MNDEERIDFALRHVFEKSVGMIAASDWHRIVRGDGGPTILLSAPQPLSAVHMDATVITITASGIINPDPGLDVVRDAPEDAPYVVNIDHYSVIEALPKHPTYERVLRVANLGRTSALDDFLMNHVFFVGPYDKEFPLHWCEVIPRHIREAKWRYET